MQVEIIHEKREQKPVSISQVEVGDCFHWKYTDANTANCRSDGFSREMFLAVAKRNGRLDVWTLTNGEYSGQSWFDLDQTRETVIVEIVPVKKITLHLGE